MDSSRYLPHPFGKISWDRLGNWDYPYFLPEFIPRKLNLDEATYQELTIAERELGRLSGATSNAKDFDLLTGAYSLIESLNSSQIEGTQSTLDEVMSNEIPLEEIQSLDLREVMNYRSALELGQSMLRELPLTQRLFLALQKELLSGVRGQERAPGEIRQSPVWVGTGNGPAEARFIPPLPHHIGDLLADWEKFVNEPNQELVLWLALSHYQFETIHPLLDGNGRIGRILIELQLVNQGILPRPALGISSYFERHRAEYYQRLQAVRETGDIGNWIGFFARAVADRARASRLMLLDFGQLREKYLEILPRPELVDALLQYPITTVSRVQKLLGVSQPTAASYLDRARQLGLVELVGTSGRGAKQTFVATEAWAILQAHQSEN